MSDGKVLFGVREDVKLVRMVSKYPYIYDTTEPLYKDLNVKDNAWGEIAEYVDRSIDDCKKRWRNIKDTYYKRQKKGKSLVRSVYSKGKKWALADMLTFLNSVAHKRKSLCNVKIEESFSIEEDAETSRRERSNTPPASCSKDTSLQNSEEIPSCVPPSINEKQNEDILSFIPPIKKTRENKEIPPFLPLRKKAQPKDDLFQFIDSCRRERESVRRAFAGQRRYEDDDVDLFFKSIACSVKKLRADLIQEAKMRCLHLVFELENRNSLDESHFEFPRRPTTPSGSYSGSTTPTHSTVDNTTNVGCDYSEFPCIQTDDSL